MSEPTLSNIAQQLAGFRAETKQELDKVSSRLEGLTQELDKVSSRLEGLTQELTLVKQRIDTLDSRFFEFSMRIVSTNQTAFYGAAVAILSAAIAFVVARLSGGPLR